MSDEKGLKARWKSSAFAGPNAGYLEQLYEEYLQDPESVDPQWRTLFRELPRVDGIDKDISHAAIRAQFRHLTPSHRRSDVDVSLIHKQVRVLQLINAYRFRGHQLADLDPLGLRETPEIPELTLAHHELSDADLDTEFETGSLVGPDRARLAEILNILVNTYCGSVGSEYMHLVDTTEKRWIQHYLESARGHADLSEAQKRDLFDRLAAAETLEKYLHNKYVGQKRFSLEGAESLIPMLHRLIQRGGETGVKEMAIGMAHRGRLNLLVNVLGKTPEELFREFEGVHPENGNGTGDVKYHLGFSSNLNTPGGLLHVALAFNPSHLEIVDPVVEGSVRARQDRRQDQEGSQVVPVLIHGDASFSGQGVVMETLNMSQSRGFSTKGTVHIVINNQIGFTTSNQDEARSTLYCTDVGKMVSAPIFHVNADDPEAVLFITQLAIDYRMRFYKDVIIDLVCYRRHGHSEADEPMATQPLMYQHISKLHSSRELYQQRLESEGVIDSTAATQVVQDYRSALEHNNPVVREMIPPEEADYPYSADWSAYHNRDCVNDIDTAVDSETLLALHDKLDHLPEGFKLHRTVEKIMDNRRRMASGELEMDWGFAETLAYASLLHDGYPIRISGEDSGRGTFFHRQAVLYNQDDGEAYVPLRNLSDDQPNFLVINSLLSEEAVLAFEYGYSTTDPRSLVIWEAQFGDFANGAQVVIDQFISAAEQKWDRLSGITLFLPHGYEGQGPEHSSARLERFLQLCAQHNMQICIPTHAAQIFHLLRRQMLRQCRRPLIVMTPKSLLRLPEASRPFSDLSQGKFYRVIDDEQVNQYDKVKRLILCSGKVYYDLDHRRRQDQREDVAIVRIEQLYPFPEKALKAALKRYPNVQEYIWCQEEPMNQGAWYSSQHHMRHAIGEQYGLQYAGRPLMAAPAVGYPSLHKQQQEKLVADALGTPPDNKNQRN
ncbi:2-oxoglutarate dehydrogenase E1 component [Thiohalophilus thiocyanatoxydans]|uniref:2-oxoglutarate dehydrogenase E1 component n=1 Tax=Thiohalophilus thiocyanatoxydans TaxID=381308 RepID=A0A4R8ISG9_9GAMM|nr:2-oxoglutarate dehydrogenase E1 component [Thiohalophilus thiocyanatoxydans]TDY03916.1 2-oxoglutarate dehydrogenase E1 component [Thiohalophilus thiocyanatoxydans]